MDGYTDLLETVKLLANRDVANSVKHGAVQIKGLQDRVWWIHDCQTHNHLMIATDFDQVVKRDTDREGEGGDKRKGKPSR